MRNIVIIVTAATDGTDESVERAFEAAGVKDALEAAGARVEVFGAVVREDEAAKRIG